MHRLGFETLFVWAGARYPSGKGEVCKTFMRRFDSDPRLQSFIFAFLGILSWAHSQSSLSPFFCQRIPNDHQA